MKKVLLWILGSFLAAVILFLASAFLFASYYEGIIKKLFVNELNKRLQSEISVGDIRFSILKQFPLATLEFQDLVAKDATTFKEKDTLLKAGALQLSFNIRDIYRKKYVIKRINLKDAVIQLKVWKDLSDNFHFWKPADSTSTGSFSFSLQRISLSKVGLRYHNLATRQLYSIFFKQMKGRGNFSDQKFDLKIAGQGTLRSLRSGKLEYLRNKAFDLTTALSVDQDGGTYTISKGSGRIGKLDLELKGSVVYLGDHKTMDLSFLTPGTDLEQLLEDLPLELSEKLKDYRLKGLLKLNIHAGGPFGGKDLPDIKASFELDKGSVTYSKENISLENLSLKGTYSNGASSEEKNHHLHFQQLHATLNKGSIDATLDIKGFEPSFIDLSLTSDLSLSDVVDFIPTEKIPEADGRFNLKLLYQGQVASLDSITTTDFLQGTFSGSLELKEVNWKLKDQQLAGKKLNGSLSFNNNDLEVHRLSGILNDNTFTLEGSFTNLVPFIISGKENLDVNARISSPSLDLKDLFIEKTKGKDTLFLLAFPDRWSGSLQLKVDQLVFGSFHGTQVLCDLNYYNKRLIVNQLDMGMAGGTFKGKGLIDGSLGDNFQVTADATLRQVKLNELFKEFGNFGQDYILSTNLKGNTNATIQTVFRMSSGLGIYPASLVAGIDVQVDNGELIDFKPISGLGKYLKLDDLKDVRFSTLKNNIYIKDKVVTIPSMEVNSDAVNFKMSGTHTFDNRIDYRFQVLLSEIMARRAKKAKKENEEFGIVQDDGSGRTTLYLLMTGTVDDPVFRYDSKGVKGKIITNFLNEKENFTDLVRKEFTKKKKEQDSLSAREEFLRKKQEEKNVTVDWENSISDSLAAQKAREEKKPAVQKKNPQKKTIEVIWEEEDQPKKRE